MALSKPNKHGQQPPAKPAKPDPNHPDQFPGSTFAPNVPDGPPSDVAGYVTAPDSRGGARYTATENYYNDKSIFPKGPPADACRKFITERTAAVFPLAQGTIDSIMYNTAKANLAAGLPGGQGASAPEPSMCDVLGSPHNALHMADTMAFRGTGRDGTPPIEVNDTLIAYWKEHSFPGKPYYPRTPFAVANDAPEKLGGGL
jgi:hypothetical protein